MNFSFRRVSAPVGNQTGKEILYSALQPDLITSLPFYRELRRYDGTLNTALKSQKSWQAVAGFDYNFKGWGRPMRLTTEAYYKYMTDVDPYDIDNVRIRYFGNNNAKAYAAGIEMRLFGELVKDAESWISIGIMNTKENIIGDTYKIYTLDSLNQPTDSSTVEGGWFRRPTDRRITFGMFFPGLFIYK
ncbi:MAG: hypothetical protein WDO19_06870 [Bacteroidota bacterium]